jgi:hypothetical protein
VSNLKTESGSETMTTPEEQRIYEAMGADPELRDENDPTVKREQFELMKAMGDKPEDIWNDPEFAEEYRAWLLTQKDV